MAKKQLDKQERLEKRILREINKSGHSLEEVKEFIKSMDRRQAMNTAKYKLGTDHLKVGVFSDPHIGNISYDTGLNKFMLEQFDKEDVDMVLCGGDIFDGWYQNRPSSIFEQNAIGFDQQMTMAVNEYKDLNKPFYFITGNHSYNTFVRGAGVEAGPYFESKLQEQGVQAHFLGNAEGDIEFGQGSLMRLLHPDGGTAYALSYKPQKIVESFEGGHKPQVLFIAHFHKADYMFYRNVHVFQTATLCGQTKYMKGKGIAAHKGFWTVDIYGGGKGDIDAIEPKFFPAYD